MIAHHYRIGWTWVFVAVCAAAAGFGVLFLDPIVGAVGAPDYGSTYRIDLSGFGVGLALFTALPALLAGGAYARGWIGRFAAALAAALAPLALAFSFWAYVADLRSKDPSSTGVVIFGVMPVYALAAALLVIAAAASARKIAASRRTRGAVSGPTTPAGRP